VLIAEGRPPDAAIEELEKRSPIVEVEPD